MTEDSGQMTGDSGQRTKAGYRKAYNTALRLLTRRDHSKYELARKLKQRAFEDGVIEKVFSEFERLNYLNDDRTARLLIDQLVRRGYGAKRIRAELKRKGLTGSSICGILTAMLPEAGQQQIAERVLIKNIKRFDNEADRRKKQAKIHRFLFARGFSYEVISEVMKKYFDGISVG